MTRKYGPAVMAAWLSMGCTSFSFAGFFAVNDLLDDMRQFTAFQEGRDAELPQVARFQGYVAGAVDAILTLEMTCPPRSIQLGQAGSIVAAYINANPRRWHEPAFEVVFDSLLEAFPCKQESGYRLVIPPTE